MVGINRHRSQRRHVHVAVSGLSEAAQVCAPSQRNSADEPSGRITTERPWLGLIEIGPSLTVAECIGAAAEDGISAGDLEKAAGGSLKEYLRTAIINTSE